MWFNQNNVPFPIPEDFDWVKLTYLNALALKRGFVDGEALKFDRDVFNRSLF